MTKLLVEIIAATIALVCFLIALKAVIEFAKLNKVARAQRRLHTQPEVLTRGRDSQEPTLRTR